MIPPHPEWHPVGTPELFLSEPVAPVIELLDLCRAHPDQDVWKHRAIDVFDSIVDRLKRFYSDAGRRGEHPHRQAVAERLSRFHKAQEEVSDFFHKLRLYRATLNSLRPDFYKEPDEDSLWQRAVEGEVARDERLRDYVFTDIFTLHFKPVWIK